MVDTVGLGGVLVPSVCGGALTVVRGKERCQQRMKALFEQESNNDVFVEGREKLRCIERERN